MDTSRLTPEQLEIYNTLKERIAHLEKRQKFLDSEIPALVIREQIKITQKALQLNTDIMFSLFGENHLEQ